MDSSKWMDRWIRLFFISVDQSGPENPWGNLVFSFQNTKTFVGTDLSSPFQFGTVRFIKPVVWCAAMGELAGRTARTKRRQNIMHVLSASISQAFVLKLREKQVKLGTLCSRKLYLYSYHSYGPTVNQLLPGAGRMFKALWDRSVQMKSWIWSMWLVDG